MAMPVPPGLEEEGTERAPNYLSSTVRNAGRNPERGRRGKSRSYELDPANRVYAFRFGEARGEPYKGMVAVASVVLNRVKSSEFPNSIAKVIYQSGAFSVVPDGQINMAPNQQSLDAARDAMNGWDPSGGALFFYNPAKTSNKYIRTRPVLITIGSHVFCR